VVGGKKVNQNGRRKLDSGDRVKVKDGTFAGREGEIKEVLEAIEMLRV